MNKKFQQIIIALTALSLFVSCSACSAADDGGESFSSVSDNSVKIEPNTSSNDTLSSSQTSSEEKNFSSTVSSKTDVSSKDNGSESSSKVTSSNASSKEAASSKTASKTTSLKKSDDMIASKPLTTDASSAREETVPNSTLQKEEPIPSQQETTSEEGTEPTDYVALLRDYAESGEWKSYCNVNEGAIVDDCDDMTYYIFDLDSDSIPEMLIYAVSTKWSTNFVMSASSFCVISDGAVKTVVSGSTCGGSLGGTTISLSEELSTGRLLVRSNTHIGGFGGTANDSTIYSYAGGALSEVVEFRSVEYNSEAMGTNEYKINSVDASKDEVQSKSIEYSYIRNQDISSKLQTY